MKVQQSRTERWISTSCARAMAANRGRQSWLGSDRNGASPDRGGPPRAGRPPTWCLRAVPLLVPAPGRPIFGLCEKGLEGRKRNGHLSQFALRKLQLGQFAKKSSNIKG